jgi:hypothetical protein
MREREACHGAENLLQLIEMVETTNTHLYTTINFPRIVSLNDYCPYEGAGEPNVARFGKKVLRFQKP